MRQLGYSFCGQAVLYQCRVSINAVFQQHFNKNLTDSRFFNRMRRYAQNIYNAEDKLYILKLSGFE